MKFFSALIVASFASVVLATPAQTCAVSTVDKVLADLNACSTEIHALDSAIDGNPLQLHAAVSPVVTTVQIAQKDVEATASVSRSDAQIIFDFVKNNIFISITSALTHLDDNHGRLAAVKVIVTKDLKTLQSANSAFVNALISKTPTDLVPQVEALLSQVNAKFISSIKLYA